MVIILKFDSNIEEYFSTLFKERNIDYKISLREIDITKADHIILPDTDLLPKVIKKMQLMNLYSLLRMKKIPILGVNNGMILMCNKIVDINKTGLGFFNIDVNTISTENDDNEKLEKVKIEQLKKSKLLNDEFITEMVISEKNYLESNSFSKLKIQYNRKELSFIMEKDNYFGIQMNIEKNNDLFNHLLLNFLHL